MVKRATKIIEAKAFGFLWRSGKNFEVRLRRSVRNSICSMTPMIKKTLDRRAGSTIVDFLKSASPRLTLFTRLYFLAPKYIDSLGYRALYVKEMKMRRREFLGDLAQRELHLMLEYYKNKKKTTQKKIMNKLQAMKPRHLTSVLDDYFFKICFDFYRRQMHIYCILKNKYIKDGAINVTDSKFQFDHGRSLFGE